MKYEFDSVAVAEIYAHVVKTVVADLPIGHPEDFAASAQAALDGAAATLLALRDAGLL